jgi:hypothetical protein
MQGAAAAGDLTRENGIIEQHSENFACKATFFDCQQYHSNAQALRIVAI